MATFRLNEAVAFANKTKRVKKKDLAKKMWKDSQKEKTAAVNFANLCQGKTKTIDIEFVPLLCKELGVTADFLFGLEDQPSRELTAMSVRKELSESIDMMTDTLLDIKETIQKL